MSELSIIILAYLLQWLTLVALIRLCSAKLRVFLIHLVIQLIYTVFFIVGIESAGPGGGVLAFIIFWPISVGIHWVVTLVLLIVKTTMQSK